MKKQSVILLCAAAIAVAGCTRSEEPNVKHEGGKGKLVKFYADVVKQAGSRASIEVGESDFTCEWEADDALGIVPTFNGAKSGVTKFIYNGTSFAFEGDDLPSEENGSWEYMAFHPHATITATPAGAKAHVPFGNLRMQNGNAFNSNFDALVAEVEKHEGADPGMTADGKAVSFSLKRLTSILNFKVTGTGSEKVRHLRLSTEGGEPLSAASLDFELGDGHDASVALSATDRSDVIVVGYNDNSAPAANALDALINIPAGNYENVTFEVFTEGGNRGTVQFQRNEVGKPFVAGTLYQRPISDMAFTPVQAPAFEWEGKNLDDIHDIVEGLEANIGIKADGAVAGLKVVIDSPILSPEFPDPIDLFSFASLGELLPGGALVQYKKSVDFDITDLLPMIVGLASGEYEKYEGTVHAFIVTVSDLAGNETTQSLKFRIPYLGTETRAAYNYDADLWANTASFELMNIPEGTDPSKVVFEYRIKREEGSEEEWIPVAAQGNKVKIVPEWQTATHAGADPVWKLNSKKGVFAKNIYEYRLTVNDAVVTSAELDFSEKGDDIPGFDASTTCFKTTYSPNTTESEFWGSGNNTFATTLCKYDATTVGAVMKSMKPVRVVNLAPGNLFTGSFQFNFISFTEGGTGTVRFGQKYVYSARPTAMKFKCKGTIGTVTAWDRGEFLSEGEQDQASFRVCIMDWDDRHLTSSGSATPVGPWDPETKSGLTEAEPLIAYGATYPTSLNASEMTEIILPLNYYQKDAAAPTGKYTIIISCATSRYGDYLNGSKDNNITVSEFEWIY